MRVFTSVYLLLFIYTVAALVFWGLSLEKQNKRIFEQDISLLQKNVDSARQPLVYADKYEDLRKKLKARKSQYIGEGATFFLVILIGASVVWTSFHRSIQLSKQQNNFMLSVTHELKSPIAAIKLNLQTLEKHKLDADKQQLLLDRSVKEANRLNDLCTNMLLASQFEGRQYVAAKEVFNFSDLAEDCVKDYAHRYPREFEEDIIGNCKITGDRLMLQMAINNLLENAVKYTPSDRPITIRLAQTDNHAVLQVADKGPGIPDTEKKKVFNKFYRLGSEESRKTKGTGLGLYIISKVVKQHKGSIVVKDNKPNGSIFEMTLPV
jgi:signal transduction histidine kinase